MTLGPGDQRAVASVATQFFVNGAVFASFTPRLPEIREQIGVSTAELGALMTIALLVGLLGSAASSPIIERAGTRRTLIAGSTIMVATLPLLGYASTPLMFVAALGALAAVDVLVDVAMNLQGSWLSARRHAPIMNRLHGLWSLGTVAGGLVAARLAASDISLQNHLLGVAVLLGFAVLFVSRGLLRTDEQAVEGSQAKDTSPRRNMTAALVVLALAGGLAIAVELISNDWAAFRLSDDFGASAGFAGLGFVAFTGGMTVGRFGGDSLQLRFGDEWVARVSVIAAAAGLAMAAFVPNRYGVLAGYVLAGIGISTFFPKLYDDAAQLPGRRGAGLAALTAGSRVTALVTPITIGALAATSLTVGQATGLIVLPSVLGFAAIVLWVNPRI